LSKFIVLDHLLRSGQGHHLTYDLSLLGAAERRGWQPVLAGHHDFAAEQNSDERQALDPSWLLCRTFRVSDADYRLAIKPHRAGRKLASLRQSSKPLGLLKRGDYAIKQMVYQARFDRVMRAYGNALDEFWASASPRPGDVVFLPTTMMIDVAGLAHWVRRHPAATEINWAFNLHFPLVNIETWYGDSVREYGKLLLWYPQAVAELSAALPADRVRWYTTSESMRAQLAYFIGQPFEILPYPVNPAQRTADHAHETIELVSSMIGQGERSAA
jgi:hypothetical protein